MLTATPWYYLPQFRPARLQDCVLWLEPDSFNGGIWRNLAPNYTDRNHGTAHGGVGLSSWHPQFPPAPIFYGDDEFVEVPDDDSLDITDAITIEAWVKPLSLPFKRWDGIVEKENGIYGGYTILGREDSNKLRVEVSDGSYHYINSPDLIQGMWYHITLVYDNTTGKIYGYLNGNKFDEANAGIASSGTVDCTIGVRSNKSNPFHGLIDEVRIYNRALTPAEVVHNYTHHPLYYLQRGIDPYEVIAAATAAAPSI